MKCASVVFVLLLMMNQGAITVWGAVIQLDIPPRQQWCWEDSCTHVGYCGEVGFQSALLYYGNYVSQEIVRDSDNPYCSFIQKLTGECQLLISINDGTAAANLRMKNTKFYGASSTAFLPWIKASIDLGFPVIAGFYATWGNDPDYDHIMIIRGYDTLATGAVSAIFWNDFAKNQTARVAVTNLFKTRSTCIDITQAYCLPLNYNYGIRIEGNTDMNKETLQSKLKVSSWMEPDYSSEDQVKPKPAPISLSSNLTISGVIKGYKYSILRFDNYNDTPSLSFGKSTKIARQYCFTAPVNGTYNFVVPGSLLSNQSYFFRTVRNNTCIPK